MLRQASNRQRAAQGDTRQTPQAPPTPPTIDTAALARLSFQFQRQMLVIPQLGKLPTTYSVNSEESIALQLAEDLTLLGLGSLPLWRKHDGNILAYIPEALDSWLKEQGVDELEEHVEFSFSVADAIEDVEEKGVMFATIEASAPGYLELGSALDAMEREQNGLGEAFYCVLKNAMYAWMRIFDYDEAEIAVGYHQECAEAEMEEGETFEQHCVTNDLHLPDIETGIPSYVRSSTISRKAAVALLKANAKGSFGHWIGAALTAYGCKARYEMSLRDFPYEWDDDPMPSWCVAMRPQDGIVQCFDEACQSYYETNHSPNCLFRFHLGNHKELRDTLKHIAGLITVNRALVQLAKSTSQWSKDHANQCKHRAIA